RATFLLGDFLTMSYDLYFTKPKISQEEFETYFRARDHYTVSELQAVYQNKDTGIYFNFFFNHEPQKEEHEDSEAIDCTATFNLHFYRPHVFGLEAAEQVSAFIDHFNLAILDPQIEGMGDSPFSRKGFVQGWNHGNEFGYSAILKGENVPDQIHPLPGERLER